MLLLDHKGSKSGTERTTPLVYLDDGGRWVIVASKGGHAKHPAWFHNLKANPKTTIQVGSRKVPVTARVATDAERKRLWPRMVDIWSDYAEYQKRTDRKIPLVVLEPR
jgi:deazaflavin-dependent oxidoreductase (nitroreductase family)